MASYNLKVQIKNNKVAFLVERDHQETTESILQLIGALDLVKQSQLQKIGELARVKKEQKQDEEE